jgi:hypothetical protein
MYSLIRKSAVLLSILTLLPLLCALAAPKNVPFRLIDGGAFIFTGTNSANLVGSGLATHMGKIVSGGKFERKAQPNSPCENGFKGEINGTATAANGDMLTYSLSAQFCPDPGPNASDVFNGVGTYEITGGTGRFAKAKGSGQFIGLADFRAATYNCLLSGTISY